MKDLIRRFTEGKLFLISLFGLFLSCMIIFSGCTGSKQAVKEAGGEKTDSSQVSQEIPAETPVTPAAQVQEAPVTPVSEETNMVLIPAGEFEMGCDKGGDPMEAPVHKVQVDAFNIDKFEVTNADYKKFIDDGGYQKKELWSNEGWAWKEKSKITAPQYFNESKYNGAEQPVCGISWYEAEAYANWVGKRLPTEAEWEKAAKGTDGRKFPWGNDYKKGLCNNKDEGIGKPTKIGKYIEGASPYGLLDMAGNVNEWCLDYFGREYYKSSPGNNPKGPDKGKDKVIRGGGFSYDNYYCRTTRRGAYDPTQRSSSIGLRCVKDVKK